MTPTRMRFDVGPWRYFVAVCPGPLARDGVEVAALTHEREILIAGDIRPRDRIAALFDQLARLHQRHCGPFTSGGFATFAVSAMRQLLMQGGESALRRMRPAALELPGDVPGDAQRKAA